MSFLQQKNKFILKYQEKKLPNSESLGKRSHIGDPNNKRKKISIQRLKVDNPLIFSRLKETPTFHLSKTLNNLKKPLEDPKFPKKNNDYLQFCNLPKLDNLINKQSMRRNEGNDFLENNKNIKEFQKNMLYYNKNRVLKKEKNIKYKSKTSQIYERFFNRPNLNEMVNLSDLLKRKKIQMNTS